VAAGTFKTEFEAAASRPNGMESFALRPKMLQNCLIEGSCRVRKAWQGWKEGFGEAGCCNPKVSEDEV